MRLRHDDAFAGGEAVGFDDDRRAVRARHRPWPDGSAKRS